MQKGSGRLQKDQKRTGLLLPLKKLRISLNPRYKTRLSDYGYSQTRLIKLVYRLRMRGWIKLGDRGLVTLAIARSILESRL